MGMFPPAGSPNDEQVVVNLGMVVTSINNILPAERTWGVRVQTDPEDREAVCAALCEHTLIVDPRLVADEKTIVSMIRAWTGSSHWPHPFY